MRLWLLALVAMTRSAFADPTCDVAGRSDASMLFGAARVIEKPKPLAGSLVYSTIAMRWELGAELADCAPTPIRLSFTATLQSDNQRPIFVPENPEGFIADRTYLQFGGALEAQLAGPWWLRLGAERSVLNSEGGNWNISAGGRLRPQGPGFLGFDLVVSTACADCLSGTSVGFVASGGLQGRGSGPVIGSVLAAVVIGLVAVVGYAKSMED
jgi:hypothetical protein